jgi:hypothetical protein
MTPPRSDHSRLASMRLGEPESKRSGLSSLSVSIVLHAALVIGLIVIVPLQADLPFLSQEALDDRGIEVWLLPPPEPPPPEPVPYVPPAPAGVAGGPAVELVQPNLADIGTGIDLTLPPLEGLPGYYGGETSAERLQPGFRDGRLFGPLPEEFRTLTPEQREEILIATRFGAWNDSAAAAAAAEAAMRDWTFTDGDGDRWGVSDGQLHLGGLGAIPLPFAVQGSASQRDYLRTFDEMQRQGASALIQQSVRERQEAIRARRDAERATPRADTAATQR